MREGLVLSVSEAAEALGVSEDLVYELTQRGDLPCLRFGRRKVIPRRAIEVVIERAMDGFDPHTVLVRLASAEDAAREDSGLTQRPVHPPATRLLSLSGEEYLCDSAQRSPPLSAGAPDALSERSDGGTSENRGS